MLGLVSTKSIRVEEARGRLLLEAKDGDIWEAVLITAGEGSSGNYTPELLEQSVAAFPKGTKHWFGHTDWLKSHHDPRDQWGVSVEDAWYDPAREAIVGKIKLFPQWRDVVETIASEGEAELSISAAAAINEETGEIVAILYHRTNSVDLVDYAGRPGSKLTSKMFEHARESHKPGVTSASVEEGSNMDEEKVKRLVEAAIADKLAPVLTFVNESAARKAEEAQAKVDAEALSGARKEAVEAYRASEKLIAEADLLEPQAAELRERVASGAEFDLTKAIESAKQIKDAAVQAATAAAEAATGLSNGSSAGDDDWSVTL